MPHQKIFQFKISLNGSKPPIWRRVQIPSNYNFEDFHYIIQGAMGWYNSHLHQFEILNPNTGEPDLISSIKDEFGEEFISGNEVKISQYFSAENNKASYIYDFGDDWEHTITLEKILEVDKKLNYPLCITGKRACPPEDCGGIWAYSEILEILKNPKHPEYKEIIHQVGHDFDPAIFNPKNVNF